MMCFNKCENENVQGVMLTIDNVELLDLHLKFYNAKLFATTEFVPI